MNGRSNRRVGVVVAVALAGILGIAAAARAHEGHDHEAKGTVKAIEATKLTLDSTEGKVLLFTLSAQTKFLRGTAEVKREEVVVGERAIVKYQEKGEANNASEVRLGVKQPG